MMLKLFRFLWESQHQTSDVDSSDQQSQKYQELVSLEVDDGPAPSNHNEKCSNERFSDVLQHHVQDLEKVNTQTIETKEDYMDEAIQIRSPKHYKTSKDCNLQAIWFFHGQQVTYRVCIAKDEIAPDQHDHYVSIEQTSTLPKVASIVGKAES